MSYDMALWEGPRPATNADALAEFNRLYAAHLEDTTSAPSPAIVAFVDTLLAKFPDITTDAGDDSPWADGPLINNASGPDVYLAMTFSGANEGVPFIAEAAARQGLVCFDPQESELV